MATIEKLFAQIFERKQWIIDQVKHQTELFDQQLASRLLIQGIHPPPWLLNPKLRSQTSNVQDLKKEDLISGILLTCPQPAVSYSRLHCSIYNNPAVEAVTKEFSDGNILQQCAANDACKAGDMSMLARGCPADVVESASKDIPGQEISTASPPDRADGSIPEICPDSYQSLAIMQRSRSRQRALELRNSAKSGAKSSLNGENNCVVNSSGILGFKSASQLPKHACESLQYGGHSNISYGSGRILEGNNEDGWRKEHINSFSSDRVTRSKISQKANSANGSLRLDLFSDNIRESCGVVEDPVGRSLQQPNCVGDLVNPSNIKDGSCEARLVSKYCSSEDTDRCITDTRSKCSKLEADHLIESLKVDSSFAKIKAASFTPSQAVGISMQQPCLVSGPSSMDETSKCCEVREVQREESQNIEKRDQFSGRITRSVSSIQKSSSANESLKAASFSSVAAADGGIYRKDFGKSEHPPESVNKLFEPHSGKSISCVKEPEISHCIEKSSIYCGRMTRARSSAKKEDESPNLDSSSYVAKEQPEGNLEHSLLFPGQIGGDIPSHNAQGSKISAERSSSSTKEVGLCSLSAEDNSHKEAAINDNAEKIGTTTTSSTEGKLSSSKIYAVPAHRGRRSASVAPRISQVDLPAIRSEGSDLQRLLGPQSEALHCPSAIYNVKEAYAATTAQTGTTLDNPVVSHISSRFVEVSSPSLPRESAMLLEPKQLNFDDVDGSSMNIRNSALENEREDRSLVMSGTIILKPTESLNAEAFGNCYDLCNLSSDRQYLDGQRVCSEGELMRDSSENHKSMIGEVEMSSHGHDSFSETYEKRLKFDAASNVEVMDEDCGNAGVHTSLDGQEISETSVEDHSLSSDFNEVIRSTSLNVPSESFGDLSAMHPPNSVHKTSGNIVVQQMEPESHPFEKGNKITPNFFSSIPNNSNSVDFREPVELHISGKPMPTGRTVNLDCSWPQHKRRKVENQFTGAFSESLNLRVGQHKDICKGATNGYLHNLAEKLDTHTDSQPFSVFHEDLSLLNVSGRLDSGIHQDLSCYIKKLCDIPQLRDEGRFSLGGIATSGNMTIPSKGTGLEAICCSSLTNEACENTQAGLMVEGRPSDPVHILYDNRGQHVLDGSQDFLEFEDQSNLADMELLPSAKRTSQEMKYEDGLFSRLVESPHDSHLDLAGTDPDRPIFEGFLMPTGSGQPSMIDEVSFNELDVASSAIKRASVLEHLCKSASMHTPLSQFSNTYKFYRTEELHKSVPNGLFECKDQKSALHPDNNSDKQSGASSSDCCPFSSVRFTSSISKPYSSPVGKLWEGFTFKYSSGSSERRTSSNPELTCFPIEEEEIVNVDEVLDKFNKGNGLMAVEKSIKREPLAEIREKCLNPPAFVSAADVVTDRVSIESFNTEFSFTAAPNEVKQKPTEPSSKRRVTKEGKENKPSVSTNGVKMVTASLRGRASKQKLSGKGSLRNKGKERGNKHNNIVSNINSFIPLVQQKQAAAVCTGKRDVKVKALEAAEAAKRLEEKRENERKMKKEAMKLQRTRLEQEKEQIKRIKEEERKKKDAEMAAKKRLREEGERKEKERKRKRIEEGRKQQKEEEGKLGAENKESEILEERLLDCGTKKLETGTAGDGNMGNGIGEDAGRKMTAPEPGTRSLSKCHDRKESSVIEDCDALSKQSDLGKAASMLEIQNDNSATRTSREQSYELSPYQGSDDEEDEEEDVQNKKFIPLWASKSSLLQVIYKQQDVDPNIIFPRELFCNIDEVLLPRRHIKQAAA